MSQDFPSVHSSSPTLPADPFSPTEAPPSTIPANTLIDLSSPPRSQTNASQPPPSNEMAAHTFGNAAVDIEALEKEIAAKELNRQQQYANLSGDMAGAPSSAYRRSANVEPSLEAEFNTLDEPIWDSMNRDLKTVSAKFSHVLIPKNNQQLLKDWDLWGPLFICVFLSLLLQSGSNSKGPHFTEVFILTFFGSVAVTTNIKLLGGAISFFQAMCVLGYCLLAPLASAVGLKLISMVLPTGNSFGLFIRLVITALGFGWATYASMNFLSGSQSEKRKILVAYPVFLFYFVVSWLIVSNL